MRSFLSGVLLTGFCLLVPYSYGEWKGTSSNTSTKETEAGIAHSDPNNVNQFCCHRDRASGFAQEMSLYESRLRVNQVLAPKSKTSPQPSAPSGNR